MTPIDWPHLDRPRLGSRLFRAIAVASTLALAACGSSSDPGSGGADGGGGGGGGGGQTLTLTMDTFQVPPGGEVYKCQNFADPFDGEVEVSGFESHMTPGSHHLLLFYINDNADGPLTDCNGLDFYPTPYGAQAPDSSISYPDGIATLVPAGQGLQIQAHYLNTSDQTVTAAVQVTFHLADPGTITAHAGMLFMNNGDINVDANSTGSATRTCAVQGDVHLLYAQSHMHQHGVEFTATDMATGDQLYHTTNWDDPPLEELQPAIDLHDGDQIQWTCDYNNTTGQPLHFGPSAETNEMCIFFGQYYPVASGSFPNIGC